MVILKVPLRFSNININAQTCERFKRYLGGIETFFHGRTIQYMNLRILTDNNHIRFRIVNNKSTCYRYSINEYVKAILRTYSDAIITTEKYLMNNEEDNFEIDYDNYELDEETYFRTKSKDSKKKSVGVFTRDLKINLLKSHPLFLNSNFDKHLLIPENKLEKSQDEISQINQMNLDNNSPSVHKDDRNNIYINPIKKHKIEFLNATKMFLEHSKAELCFIEGNGDHPLTYLDQEDPVNIPSDIIVVAFVKDGEYKQEDLSRPFSIWNKMEKNFIKLYQSKQSYGKDGSTWFFSVFKKRMLIKNGVDNIELTSENPLFDGNFFKNQF